jgi:polyisoprenoid-binding protein YceI
MKKLIIPFLIFTQLLIGQSYDVEIDQEKSYVRYSGKHMLHGWSGISNAILGEIYINERYIDSSNIHIRIPLISFDSGNSNRDSNMLFTVEELTYPAVEFFSNAVVYNDNHNYTINGVLNFHGIQQNIEVVISVQKVDEEMTFASSFSIRLKDFNVKKPKLLMLPIEEKIDIELKIIGTRMNNSADVLE